MFCYLTLVSNVTQLICNHPIHTELEATDVTEFNYWMKNFNKSYEEHEMSKKYYKWLENKRFIENHNSQDKGFELGLNQFADMENSEWFTRYGVNHKLVATDYNLPVEWEKDDTLPKSVDWRKKGVVTNVKNQQQCGSCWAFSAVGSMEGQHALKTGKLVSLSESQIVDCDINGTDEGCSGGLMDGAFKYVINTSGIESEKDYPYVPEDDPCNFTKNKVVATFSNYSDVKGGEEGLKRAVSAVGPISVAIDASNPSFQFYKNGVYYEPDCSSSMLDHGVTLVGYGTTKNGTDYWIVKNSWGESWGQKGYIWMARNRDNNCGIATQPSYPIV